jgi:excisionase family DNA binding protein
MKPLSLKVLYTTAELARSIGITKHVLFRLVRSQGILAYRVGAVTLIPLTEIKEKLEPVWEAICLAERNRKTGD